MTASFGQSSICTRATSRYLPPSGLKIEASPSLTSNQSLPNASTILGLMGDKKIVLALVRGLRQPFAECLGSPVIFIWRHHEAALRQAREGTEPLPLWTSSAVPRSLPL